MMINLPIDSISEADKNSVMAYVEGLNLPHEMGQSLEFQCIKKWNPFTKGFCKNNKFPVYKIVFRGKDSLETYVVILRMDSEATYSDNISIDRLDNFESTKKILNMTTDNDDYVKK
jgi:hypothetical protein